MSETDPKNYALEVTPDSALQFVLTQGVSNDNPDGSARCVMKLKHPGTTDSRIAFKVKTTQPRRYLVRPNQGIVEPGSSEAITILLVEKDKQSLLQSFNRLGQSALDHSKDKFLVQCCPIDQAFAENYSSKKVEMENMTDNPQEVSRVGKELSELLTDMWNTVSKDNKINNKKLQVRHVVASDPGGNMTPVSPARSTRAPSHAMSADDMFKEITSLRRKYDELVQFSVNLTAERDILNNSLEQTKRDLNREVFRSKNLPVAPAQGQPIPGSKSGPGILTFIVFIILTVLSFLIGVKAKHLDAVDFLFDVPVLGDVLRAEL